MPKTIKLQDLVQEVTSHQRYIDRLPNASPKNPMIIGIAGGSGSGKGVVSKILIEALNPGVTVLEMDHYYIGSEHMKRLEDRHNWDHPDALDLSTLATNLSDLKYGSPTVKPVYSMMKRGRIAPERVEPSKTILLDGIFALRGQVLGYLDFGIYVDAPHNIRLARRVKRDFEERGRTEKEVCERWSRTVIPAHLELVEPQKNVADLIVINE